MDGASIPYFGVDETFLKNVLSESQILQKLFLACCLLFHKITGSVMLTVQLQMVEYFWHLAGKGK